MIMIMINDEDDDDDINDDTDDDSKDKDYKNTLCSMSGGELFNRIQERQSFNERGGMFAMMIMPMMMMIMLMNVSMVLDMFPAIYSTY